MLTHLVSLSLVFAAFITLAGCGDGVSSMDDATASGTSTASSGGDEPPTTSTAAATATGDTGMEGTGGTGGMTSGESCEPLELYADEDADGYGDPNAKVLVCEPEDGLVPNAEDCNDDDRAIYPGATEDKCDGIDYDCSGSWVTEVPTICPTIQAAVDVAPVGSLINVLPGAYGEHVLLKGKDLTLRGIAGPEMTSIDGMATGRPLTIDSGEGPDTQIEGFTLRNGVATEGGGLRIDGASPTLVDLVIADNSAKDDTFTYGGGVYIHDSSATLRDILIKGNSSAYYGGGLAVENAVGLRLVRVRFVSNYAESYGGGASLYFSTVVGENLIFAANSSGNDGGALMAQGGSVELLQVTAFRNTAESWGGAVLTSSGVALALRNVILADNHAAAVAGSGGGIHQCDYDEVMANNCTSTVAAAYGDAAGNTPENFANMADPTGSEGNISVPPGFIDTSSPDPAAWNLQVAPGSALRDAGDPAILDPDASRSDIGAFGGPNAFP